MHTADSAARAILQHIAPLEPVTIPVAKSLGHILARDIVSPLSIPPWDNSAMDGYALASEDIASGLREFIVVEEIAAGSFPERTIQTGECARIFTGAPVPSGADCIIRQEDVTAAGRSITVTDTRDAGRNVRSAGEDIARNDAVFHAGTLITPARVGVLVSLAYDTVEVIRPPRVYVMSSGDEIVDLDQRDEVLAGRKIASSNTYTLMALFEQMGAEVVNLGIARDEPGDVREKLLQAADADLIVTSAGISVGDHDHLNSVLHELGVTDFFWRIRMRPGAPVGFGRLSRFGGTPWIGLPGNPVSTMVTFELFVRPTVRRMAGHTHPYRRTVTVTAGERIELGPKPRHFLRVTLDDRHATIPVARLTGPQGSGILSSMARADALLIMGEEQPVLEEGDTAPALILDDPVHVQDVPW